MICLRGKIRGYEKSLVIPLVMIIIWHEFSSLTSVPHGMMNYFQWEFEISAHGHDIALQVNVKKNITYTNQSLEAYQQPFPFQSNHDALHVCTKILLSGQKIFIFQRNSRSGFGSVMLSFFAFSKFFMETQNRTFIFDDSFAKSYRMSKSLGLSGFFDFQFPVLNTPDEYSRIFKELSNYGLQHLTDPRLWQETMWNDTLPQAMNYPILRIREHSDPRFFLRKRREILQHYNALKNADDFSFFGGISSMMCQTMKLNKAVLSYKDKRLSLNGIPDFRHSTSHDIPGHLGPTVAFHVRRGDKVYGRHRESKAFSEDQYVNAFLGIAGVSELVSAIKHCYVATDEFTVVNNLKFSLKKMDINCELHYLVTPDRQGLNISNRRDEEDTKDFITEIHMLAHATYFIGTFNSNVGRFVAPYRGCTWKSKDMGGNENRYHHYHHSYDIFRSDWYI